MSIFVVYGSSRENGNAEQLTNMVLGSIPHTAVHLREQHIKPIVDARHTEAGFLKVDDDYDAIVKNMLDHDTIIFSTPLYWFGMSGEMKNFIDRWSQSLRNKEINFKTEMAQKKAYTIVVGGESARIKALPLIEQFTYIFEFMGMKYDGYLIGEAVKPGEIAQDAQAIVGAKFLNDKLQKN